MVKTFQNIWDAIIDDPVERQSSKIKSELMITIERHIKEQGMTQRQAANKVGVGQPRISDIFRGKLDKFTIDNLVDILSALGVEVEVKRKDAPEILTCKIQNYSGKSESANILPSGTVTTNIRTWTLSNFFLNEKCLGEALLSGGTTLVRNQERALSKGENVFVSNIKHELQNPVFSSGSPVVILCSNNTHPISSFADLEVN